MDLHRRNWGRTFGCRPRLLFGLLYAICPATEAVMVAVSEADVRICAANYDYALTAYQWTQALTREGLAD